MRCTNFLQAGRALKNTADQYFDEDIGNRLSWAKDYLDELFGSIKDILSENNWADDYYGAKRFGSRAKEAFDYIEEFKKDLQDQAQKEYQELIDSIEESRYEELEETNHKIENLKDILKDKNDLSDDELKEAQDELDEANNYLIDLNTTYNPDSELFDLYEAGTAFAYYDYESYWHGADEVLYLLFESGEVNLGKSEFGFCL